MVKVKLQKFLYVDFEDLDVPSISSGSKNAIASGGFHVNAEDGRVTLSEVHFSELQKTIQHLTAQVIICYNFFIYSKKDCGTS